MERWKTQLPLSTPSFTFPKHLQEVEWADTRALWRVFCNRAPTDPHQQKNKKLRYIAFFRSETQILNFLSQCFS